MFYSFEIKTLIVMTKTKTIERLCFHYFKIPRTCLQNNNPYILPQGIQTRPISHAIHKQLVSLLRCGEDLSIGDT